jgi:UDP-2,4-diacetamido-2,4,6-trideoxy-beta-L-altropyranose hydrolase
MPDSKTKIYFRVDGSGEIGFGHIARCIAMTEMLDTRRYSPVFLVQQAPEFLKDWTLENGFNIIELGGATDYLREAESLIEKVLTGKEIVVLDGYKFDTEYQYIIKRKGSKLISIDDIHQYLFVSDIVINHAGGIREEIYDIGPCTELKLGPDYALLRSAFLEGPQDRHSSPSAEGQIFICMGGADPLDFTQKILTSIDEHNWIGSIQVVIGEGYQHKASLMTYLDKRELSGISVHKNVSPLEMANLMRGSSIGITSASTVAYEYLSTGGHLFVIQTSDNQDLIYRYLIHEGFAFPWDKWTSFRQSVMRRQIQIGNCIDLKSPVRIRKIVENLARELALKIRVANADDIHAVYEWVNDPEVRANSYHSENIPWEDHQKWFYEKIAQKGVHYYIAECNEVRLGQVRLDHLGDNLFIVNYLINQNFRSAGWGKSMLSSVIKHFVASIGMPVELEGHVKIENIASQKIFEKLGFRRQESPKFPGSVKFNIKI